MGDCACVYKCFYGFLCLRLRFLVFVRTQGLRLRFTVSVWTLVLALAFLSVCIDSSSSACVPQCLCEFLCLRVHFLVFVWTQGLRLRFAVLVWTPVLTLSFLSIYVDSRLAPLALLNVCMDKHLETTFVLVFLNVCMVCFVCSCVWQCLYGLLCPRLCFSVSTTTITTTFYL